MLMLSYYFFAILVAAVAVVTVVIQKFCHHGNMASHFSSLLEIRKSQDLAKDFGGTASKAEKKICKSKNCKLYTET